MWYSECFYGNPHHCVCVLQGACWWCQEWNHKAANGLRQMGPATPVVDKNSMNGITTQVDKLSGHLQLNATRHQLASHNIANVNTPGFKASEVVMLSNSQEADHAFPQRKYTVHAQNGHARLDGNNVDIDKELGKLKQSSLQHKVFTQLISTKIRQLRDAMS